MQRPSRRTYRAYLLALFGAVVIPLLAFAAFLLVQFAQAERTRFESTATQLARQIGLIVDKELGSLVAVLRGLASSTSLQNDDLAAFHAQARRLIGGKDGEVIVLRDFGTRQYLNSQIPFGTGLPPAVPLSEPEEAGLRSGRPVVSNVYFSPISGEARVAVATAVKAGATDYVLAITVPTSVLRDAILPAVPPDWLVGVADSQGRYVTRSQRHAEITGTMGTTEYLTKSTGTSGVFTARTLDGDAVIAGYSRPETSGWLVVANVPMSRANALIFRSVALVVLGGLAALALSIGLAFAIGRQFAGTAAALAEQAHQLGEGMAVSPVSSNIAEFDVIAASLADASAALRRSEEGRKLQEERRGLLLHELNHRVKNTLATVQSIARQTLRGTSPELVESLSGRLIALARSHDLLSREDWTGADLGEIVADATRPFGERRFHISGPTVLLNAATTVSMSLVAHELATNAAKYGALSVETGRVQITWSIEPSAANLLVFTWSEAGGPPVEEPVKRGFGSLLIERSFAAKPGAETVTRYGPDGFFCRMIVPLDPA